MSLRNDSDRKYGINESRGKGVSGKWIRRIMENLDKFTTIGNVAMTAAPESLGLAWFAVSQVLNAVQNDYKLYAVFNTALNDITEMMALVQTYDKIYHEHAVNDDTGIYNELSKSIREVYMSILDFSYAVKKHITGGKRSKLMHAFKESVGALNRLFEEKTATIQAQKTKIIQYSEAAFQQKTTDKLGDVSGEMVSMKETMREVFEFHQQSSNEWKEVLCELKATKVPTHHELAFMEYEKNMKLLARWLDASAATNKLTAEREADTCTWINEVPEYVAWRDSGSSSVLCVTGAPSSGKSVLGVYVCKALSDKDGDDASNLVQYISQDAKSAEDGGNPLERIEQTLIRGVYKHAVDTADDELHLQQYNRLFTNPKQAKSKGALNRNKISERPGVSGRTATSEYTLDMMEVYPGLVEAMQSPVFVIVDAIDGLSDEDQARLAERVLELKDVRGIVVRILIFCRLSSSIRMKMSDAGISQILMGEHNENDIKLVINKALQTIPGLSPAEKSEIEGAIVQKTGHRIRYVKQVALPFLRSPLQRPVSVWLEDLPENVNEAYDQHLRELAPKYRPLLRAALGWTLVAQVPLRVEEIMEAYSHAYLDGDGSGEKSVGADDSRLYREQIQKAGGPFLEIRDNHDVVLQDAQAVRSFCTSAPDTSADEQKDEPLCAKCKSSVRSSNAFAISEKHEHLAMAIICLQHMNSPAFQASCFSQSLEEARSLAEDRLKVNDNAPQVNKTAYITSENPNKPEPSAGKDESGGLQPETNGHAQEGTPEDNVSPSEEAEEAEEVDDDDSTYSNPDEEDFDMPIIDTENDESVKEPVRYELEGWFYHVREAERLWPSSERENSAEWQTLLRELERFFLLEPVAFQAWKLAYVWYPREAWEPIMFAALYGLTSLAEMLLDKGANVMAVSPAGFSVLAIAVEAPNQLEMLRLFLNRGANPNFQSSGIPAFHDWLGYDIGVDCVQEFLNHGASCTMIDKTWKWNALHHFGLYGSDIKILDLLLSHPDSEGNRVDINVRDGEGETPLHKLLGRVEIPIDLLEAFLARGADVNAEDRASEQPLLGASYWGENAAIRAIIDRVRDVDDENDWGRTALSGAALAGQNETVSLLIEHGAKVNHRDKHNRTPLVFACVTSMHSSGPEGGHQAAAERLVNEQIKSGASFSELNVCTKRGRTPLREAAGRGFVSVVSAILEKMGPEDKEWINKPDHRKGRTPLHSAATHGRGEVIALLLQHGADPNLRDGKDGSGMTSLELCLDRWTIVGSKRYELAMTALIGACVEEAKSNTTLLTTAAIHGSVPVLERLASLGMKLDVPDSYGWTPSQLAAQFGHAEATLFIQNTLTSRALRPSRWTLKDNRTATALEDEGRHVHHKGGFRTCILADHPMPAGLPTYYYEIDILDPETGEPCDTPTDGNTEQKVVALGFCTSAAKLVNFPGWPPVQRAMHVQSWAYHGDDGGFFASDAKRWPARHGECYGPGDTVGCGLEVEARKIFFTRNGVRIEDKSFNGFRGRVFPILGLEDKVQLRTNFGGNSGRPFKWDEHEEPGSPIQEKKEKKSVNGG